MHRRTFLGLLAAAAGFRFTAEPTYVPYVGLDLAAGPDWTVWFAPVGAPFPAINEEPDRPWTREDIARLYDVDVQYISSAASLNARHH